MPMTYDTDRGVFFDPNEIKLDKCLKCATPTTRRSPRTIAVMLRGEYGESYVRSMRNILTLCERCDMKWNLSLLFLVAGILAPFAMPVLTVLIHMNVMKLPNALFVGSFFIGVALTFIFVIWGLKYGIRVRAIDENGLIGLDNISTDVRAEIIALGMADPRSARHG